MPRSTKDADIVIQHSPEQFRQLNQKLAPEILIDRQIAFESMTGTTRNIATVPETAFQIEFFRLSDDEHDQVRFRRRVQMKFEGFDAWMQTAEDVIVWKLRWAIGRDKDRDDIREVISVSGTVLDWPYIRSWAEKHGTRRLLDEIIATIPPDLLGSGE